MESRLVRCFDFGGSYPACTIRCHMIRDYILFLLEKTEKTLAFRFCSDGVWSAVLSLGADSNGLMYIGSIDLPQC